MRVCRTKRWPRKRRRITWNLPLLVVSLMLVAGRAGDAQDNLSLETRSEGLTKSQSQLQLPESDQATGDSKGAVTSGVSVRNELRHPSSSSRALRVSIGSGEEPSAPSQSPSEVLITNPVSATRQESPEVSRGTLNNPRGTKNGQASAPANRAGLNGSIGRSASVAPPQPLEGSISPVVSQNHRLAADDKAGSPMPAVQVIGELPSGGEALSIAKQPGSPAGNKGTDSLRLAPPEEKVDSTASSFAASWARPQVMTTALSLGVVLASFFLLTWFVRRSKPTNSSKLPEEAVEILGRLPLQGKQQVQLVRFGRKLILWVVTPNSVQTLSEITDPEDVDQLMEFCEANKRGSLSESFRQVLSELGNEPTNRGFLADRSLEEIIESSSPRRRGRSERGAYEA